jgi:hypothetical protein
MSSRVRDDNPAKSATRLLRKLSSLKLVHFPRASRFVSWLPSRKSSSRRTRLERPCEMKRRPLNGINISIWGRYRALLIELIESMGDAKRVCGLKECEGKGCKSIVTNLYPQDQSGALLGTLGGDAARSKPWTTFSEADQSITDVQMKIYMRENNEGTSEGTRAADLIVNRSQGCSEVSASEHH